MDKNIELIEDLPLRAHDTWYVLLVYLGLKSGAWVMVSSAIWREGEPTQQVPDTTMRQIESTLAQIGLVYAIERRDTDAGPWQPDHGR